jgi:hypothetical protein
MVPEAVGLDALGARNQIYGYRVIKNCLEYICIQAQFWKINKN